MSNDEIAGMIVVKLHKSGVQAVTAPTIRCSSWVGASTFSREKQDPDQASFCFSATLSEGVTAGKQWRAFTIFKHTVSYAAQSRVA